MSAFPMALFPGIERFSWRRMAGLCLGLVAILFLVGPEASLPDRMAVMFVPNALITPVFYAFESNYAAKWGVGGLGSVQALLGASLVGSAIGLNLALASGQFIDAPGGWGMPDYAVVVSLFLHAVVYTSYIRLVGRAGPVFATQVAYLVTLFGMVWAVVLLAESYTPFIWPALVSILFGIFLVQPIPSSKLTPDLK